ncbi:hypothetical protein ACTPEM_26855, partial [Clostridioides difficile]
LEVRISEESTKPNSPIIEKIMDEYSHKLELFSDLNGYGYKSENNSSLCEYSSMIFSIIGEFGFVLSSDILTSNSLK